MKIGDIISALYKLAPEVRSLSELKSKIDPEAVVSKLDGVVFDQGKPVAEQVRAALEHSEAESNLLSAILTNQKDSLVLTAPDITLNGAESKEVEVAGLSLNKNQTLEVRLGSDFASVEVTDEGKLRVTPKLEMLMLKAFGESQEVIVYVKEADKFIRLNLLPNTTQTQKVRDTHEAHETHETSEAEADEKKQSKWWSIGRWTIFGVSLYQLLGIFKSEKSWFKILLGAIGTAVTAFWGKIKEATSGKAKADTAS